MSTITIIGGHGKIALLTAPLLNKAGHTVRSVIRKEEQSADIEAANATPIVADVEQLGADDIAEVLAGSDAIVWSAGAGGSGEDRTWAMDRDTAIRVMGAAQKSGIRRFVMVSYFNSRLVDGEVPGVEKGDGMYAYYNAKSQADEHLRTKTDLDWTVLGPSVLTLEPATHSITVDSSGETRDLEVPSTSRENVAHVIAAALGEPAAIGKTLNFHDGDTPVAEAVAQGV
ncbi:SDR family oxidoreductase [Brevibacterium sp. UCMA 11754]|uniref:SDR family oxidoreductase n=1 Tax=Brevibacterium sp. UCMA 11754 TaxID=2749198 RepID=UPI001F1CDC25|nr:SDR family oxidoreductase [Brevibacterium sp. UCMA 11754]MCF2573579.1 SDR family oxidoreductase [Brevibacterium sp. UCMA 11754]